MATFRNGELGLMEFAGVDKAARSKMGVWKMQEWSEVTKAAYKITSLANDSLYRVVQKSDTPV